MGRFTELGMTLAVGLASGAILALSSRALYVRRRNRQNKAHRGKSKDAAVAVNKSEEEDVVGASGLIPHHSQPQELAECFLMLHHVAKNRNVGSLLRTATAFGCTAVICVGLRKASQLNYFGAHGSEKRIKVLCFLYMDEAVQFLQDRARAQGRNRCHIVGLEITPDAKLLNNPDTFEAFRAARPSAPGAKTVQPPDSFCIIPGNEGTGLTEKDREVCDYCMIIPQFGSATASLNVSSACAIVLYQFAVAAGFVEAKRVGEKYVVSSTVSAQAVQQNQGLSRTDIQKYEQEQERRKIAEREAAGGQEDDAEENEEDGAAELF